MFVNLCRGLDRLGIGYVVNEPFEALREEDRVGVLGVGRYALHGYDRPNPIVAGIGLMTHPAEWPTLFEEYPVVKYLQHSEWAKKLYEPYFGDRCGVWPVGIDTDEWKPTGKTKDIDVLLYDKVHWNREQRAIDLIQPIRESLMRRRMKLAEIRYGKYSESEFRRLLGRSRAMVFLSEHESQGLAYQECLASDVPVLAWQQGWYLDPNRDRWGTRDVQAASVPYFDCRCGVTFTNAQQFEQQVDSFLERVRSGDFHPREYVLENLTLESCAQRFVNILDESTNRGLRSGSSLIQGQM